MLKAMLAATVALSACGDNSEPLLPPAHDVVVVAHQDDDLLFMQPDVFQLVSSNDPLMVVYVTAGDAGNGLDYVASRKNAVRHAYSAVAGAQDWTCTTIELAGHTAEHCRLADRELSMVFLDYPDGFPGGEGAASLLKLWEGSIEHAETVSASPTTYDRDGLIATITSIMDRTRPTVVRTLELAGTHGDDHSDHMMVGSLVQLALARTALDPQLIAYRGYNISSEPPNLTEEQYQQSSLFMRMYLACMTGCGVCGETACPTIDDVRYNAFLHRSYTVEMESMLTTVLGSPAGCLGRNDDGEVVLVPCGEAPAVTVDDDLLRLGDDCVEARKSGSLVLGSCEHEPARHFELDEEGHLWVGVVAAPAANALYNHTACVYAADGEVTVGTCGEDRDWRWQLVR